MTNAAATKTSAQDLLWKVIHGEAFTAEEAPRIRQAHHLGFVQWTTEGFWALTNKGQDLAFAGQEEEGPTCNICDGLGHGFPGGGPCPLEEQGTDEGPGHAWER